MAVATDASSATKTTSSPSVFTMRPPPAAITSLVVTSNDSTSAPRSCSVNPLDNRVNDTVSAKPTEAGALSSPFGPTSLMATIRPAEAASFLRHA